MSHQALGGVDHSVVKRLGRDLVQGNDGVPPLQLSLLQQFFTSHLAKTKSHP